MHEAFPAFAAGKKPEEKYNLRGVSAALFSDLRDAQLRANVGQ